MKPTRLRNFVYMAAVIAAFLAMALRLFMMQSVQHEDYVAQAQEKSQKTYPLTGKRGTIYDVNMIPLAYDRISYNVQFYRDPTHTSEEYRRQYTQSIIEVIKIVENSGKEVISDFWLERGEDGNWRFNTGTTSESANATRIRQWRGNFYLSEKEYPDVNTLYGALCTNYCIPEGMEESEVIKVLAVWQEQRMNNFTGNPITIAYDVGYETVARIEAVSSELLGISVVESSQRVYPRGSLASHTIGYVGKITSETSLTTYMEKGYPRDALVGQSGIEASLEDQLTPYIEYRQGKRTVERTRPGKIIRELSYEAPVDGNNVVLTISSDIQEVAEKALADVISEIQVEQEATMATERWQRYNEELLLEYAEDEREIQIAQTGALVAMDPNTGRVIAQASFPDYDLSMFEGEIDKEAWNEILRDDRNPMYNRAISARDTPGSIFKMVTALGALMEGKTVLDERISDLGKYDTGLETDYKPSCWVGAANIWKHSDQTVVEALAHSCNYYFYTIGQRLESTGITKWAAQLGLTSKTGIELNGESTSFVGNQEKLYDGSRAINNQFTSKPLYAYYTIRRKFLEIGEDRNIVYDNDRMDRAAKAMLDLAESDYNKSEWPAKIRDILMGEMGLPSNYISNNLLANEFYSYIQDLRWTANETIMAAIGQSITQVTPIAVARYVAAIANGGIVYNAQIVDKIISPSGEIVLDKQPTVANVITGGDAYFAAIREGMFDVTSAEDGGTAAEKFANAKYPMAAKTGTSQRTEMDIENNAWLVTFAPQQNPQIVVVVYVQNGYSGALAASAAISVTEAYLDSQAQSASLATISENTLAD